MLAKAWSIACVILLCITLAKGNGNTAICCISAGLPPPVCDDIGWYLYIPPNVNIQCHLALMTLTQNLDPNLTGWAWELDGCQTPSGACSSITPDASGPFCGSCGPIDGTDSPAPTHTDFSNFVSQGCVNAAVGVYSRRWRSNTQCSGAFLVGDQFITLVDTVPPYMAIPADLEVECPPLEPNYNSRSEMDNLFGSPDVIDYCAILTDNSINQFATTTNVGTTGVFTRSFTVSDGCTTDPFFVQTITFVDTTPPVLQRLPNTYGECTGVYPPSTTLPLAVDSCYRSIVGLVPTSNDVVYQGSCPGKYSVVRTWTVSDLDGNTVLETQVIVIDDTTPPTITPPPAFTVNIYSVNCFSDINFPYTQEDLPAGCGGVADPIVPYEVSLSHNEDEGLTEVLVKYTSSDLCGNSESWADLWQVSSGLGVFSDVISGPTQPVDKGTVFTITIDVTATNACDPFGILVVDAGFATLNTATSNTCFFQAATGVIYCDPVPATPGTMTLDLVMPTTYLGSDLLISISWHYNYRTIGVEIGSYFVSFN